MKPYYLTIVSKNEKSLKSFLDFFSKHLKTQFNVLKKPTLAKEKKKFFSLLKSPHVNKTAQEQFEFRTFSVRIAITTSHSAKNLIFLKKLTNKLFHDIFINLELNLDSSLIIKKNLSTLHPDNFKSNYQQLNLINLKRNKRKQLMKTIEKNKLSKLKSSLKIIDIFSEILINNNSKL